MNMFNKKVPVTYIKITESMNNKGIVTYFDTDKIKAINPVYKDQLISVFVSAINIISEGSLTVVRVQQEEQVEEMPKKSIK